VVTGQGFYISAKKILTLKGRVHDMPINGADSNEVINSKPQLCPSNLLPTRSAPFNGWPSARNGVCWHWQ